MLNVKRPQSRLVCAGLSERRVTSDTGERGWRQSMGTISVLTATGAKLSPWQGVKVRSIRFHSSAS
jgi:hypothetical protein